MQTQFDSNVIGAGMDGLAERKARSVRFFVWIVVNTAVIRKAILARAVQEQGS